MIFRLTLREEYKARITREDFQQASSVLFSRLRQPLERALRDARLNPEQIDGIILVGGQPGCQ